MQTEETRPILETVGLTKDFGSFRAVDDVSLRVAPGEIVALLGPNGAGKTTTMRMLTGVLVPSAGTARIGELDCFSQRAEVMRVVGYLPDEPVFYDYLRGSELLQFVGGMRGFSVEEVAARTEPLIERLQLADAIEEFVVNYSRGMKKKIGVITALLHEPRVLILDEPTNGLDPFATRTLQELIREVADAGSAVLFSTHLLDQAEKLCDRVAILHAAQLAASGRLDELRDELAPGGSLEDVFFQVATESEGGE